MTSLVASGGFAAPHHTAWDIERAVVTHELLPMFRAIMGVIDYRPPEVRWAEQRERELRAARRMWDWPRPPA